LGFINIFENNNIKKSYMPFINTILSWINTKRIEQIKLYNKYSSEIQSETLFNLLRAAQNTEWGKKYDYANINSIKEYQQNVPLSEYNDLKPFIDRMKNGEQNVLWNTPIKWFAKSSGTTQDKSKFIPVSNETLEDCHFRGGKDVLAMYMQDRQETKIIKGKALVLGGSSDTTDVGVDVTFGDLSAILLQNLPFYIEFMRVPDITIALMKEWEQKIELIAKQSIEENIVQVAGVPSWTMVLFKKVLEITGKSKIIDVWPNLELFIHGGVSFVPYKEQFDAIIGNPNLKYMETYNASEGFFGLQDDLSSSDMLLMLDLGIFYEFISLDELSNPNPQALSLTEVELNKNYAIVISTNSGLWRYIIGDTVSFTQRDPYKFKITGRIKHFINAFGEELIIDNAEIALKKACQNTNALIREYTAAPIYMSEKSKGGHEWLIEFEQQPSDINHFMETLDNELKAVNSDYEAKRYQNMTLDFPKITSIKSGVFYSWMKNRGKLGGQHKVPRLENSRKYADEIILLNSNFRIN
jgi:hypothetical protein